MLWNGQYYVSMWPPGIFKLRPMKHHRSENVSTKTEAEMFGEKLELV